MSRPQNRRTFLRNSSLGLASIAILPGLQGKSPASDRLRVAHIGLGGMGNAHMRWFANLPEVEVVALCDVDQTHLGSTLKKLKEIQPDGKVDTYEDFRSVLERQDIDAITCATPDHWHAQIASLAFDAGKDVYGEKPLSYDVREGQMMLKHLEKNNRIFQLGTQIHAGDNYHRVVEIIQSGVLGKIHTVRLWKTGAPPDLGQPKVQRPPASLNWDMWLGPAPMTEYFPERCHFNYRYFMDYSGGVFADFWCHIADVVFWALKPQGLTSIQARGKAPAGIVDTPEWLEVDYAFKDLNIYWTTTPPDVPGAKDRGIGAYFEGENGTLITDYSKRSITINGETMEDIEKVPPSIPRSPGHQQNFVDAVKSRKEPESNLAYARAMTLPMHLGLISYQLNGRKLEWNSKRERFVGDKEANKLLARKPRKEWRLIR